MEQISGSKIFRHFLRLIQLNVFLFASVIHVTVKAWEVDFSRRSQDLQRQRNVASDGVPTRSVIKSPPSQIPSSEYELKVQEQAKISPKESESSWMDVLSEPIQTGKDIVILMTENGFIPSQLSLRKGQSYHVHVVNLSRKDKNVSFVVDSFSEYISTAYGVRKTFTLNPKVEGIHPFVSPETSAQGQFVVVGETTSKRTPAAVTSRELK